MSVTENVRVQLLPRRGERRFLIDEAMASVVLGIIRRHPELSAEDPSTPWRTTVYCDTPDWKIFEATRLGSGVMMRIREYHNVPPDRILAETETWLEFKPVDEDTGKIRFALPSHSIRKLFRGEFDLGPGHPDQNRALRNLVNAGLRPVFATRYRRSAYSTQGETFRITLDRQLSYLTLPSWDTNAEDFQPMLLGPILFSESGIVLELKWSCDLPVWGITIAEFLQPYGLEAGDRKFTVGVRCLKGLGGMRHGAAAGTRSTRSARSSTGEG
jgi:VTC domain-containing protein